MPDTKPPDHPDQHLEQLPPVKRIFGYFFCNRKKSLASASAAGGETVYEFEVEVAVEVEFKEAPGTPYGCPYQLAAKRG